jgi:hypothetical protein
VGAFRCILFAASLAWASLLLPGSPAAQADAPGFAQFDAAILGMGEVAQSLEHNDGTGARQAIAAVRLSIAEIVADLDREAARVRADARACQTVNASFIRREDALAEQIRAMDSDLASLHTQLLLLRQSYDLEAASEKALYQAYLDSKSRIEEAVAKPWEFWRSFEAFGDATGGLEAKRKAVNDSRHRLRARAEEYNAKLAEQGRTQTRKAAAEAALAQLRREQATAGRTHATAQHRAGLLDDLALRLAAIRDRLSHASTGPIDGLDKLAAHLGADADPAAIGQIRDRYLEQVRVALVEGVRPALHDASAALATAPTC